MKFLPLLAAILLTSCDQPANEADRAELALAMEQAADRYLEAKGNLQQKLEERSRIESVIRSGGVGSALGASDEVDEAAILSGRAASEFKKVKEEFLAAGGSPTLAEMIERKMKK